MPDINRLQKELREVRQKDTAGVSAEPIDGSMTHLRGTVTGPEKTPYDGGVFLVDIVLPQDYPFEPPKMKFITKVWHPNVSSQTGAICLDILKNEWSPALTMKTVLLSLRALLAAPEPDDPQDAVVAKMYKSDRAQFNEQARTWTNTYAKSPEESPEMTQLMNMGFTKEQSLEALRTTGNLQAAIEKLLASA